MKIQLKQYLSAIDKEQVDALETLIFLVSGGDNPNSNPGDWGRFAHKKTVSERFQRAHKRGAATKPFTTDLPNDKGTRVSFWQVKADLSTFEYLSLARKIAQQAIAQGSETVSIQLQKLPVASHKPLVDALISALYAANWPITSFKSGKKNKKPTKRLHIYGLKSLVNTKQSVATSEGTNVARDLTQLPPNVLTPGEYRKRLRKLATQFGWQHKFYNKSQLEQKKAGAFVAVLEASDKPTGGLVHLRYQPSRRPKKTLALVGKGLCYDTGGINLKPAKFMYGMHEDMEGSAVALGTLIALSRMKVDYAIDCYLALAVNDIGPLGYRPNDVITASNGTTIEIVHTDAEGRMVLADTLAIASKAKPDLMIDYATLTGSCVAALGTTYSGAFTNREEFHNDVIDAGKKSGERVWPFPQDKDFDKALHSKIADIKQCTVGGGPDHILAARFLNRFVDKNVPWIHVDLAAGNHKGGLAHIPTETTGFGVRFTVDLLQSKLFAN
ncbi:MAG: leucyl aminopeptidase family protein [Gammaproteobacteria bacterium]|nr:leucyl aminopeptidase family protein [Gammaproteobacteria bacterium]